MGCHWVFNNKCSDSLDYLTRILSRDIGLSVTRTTPIIYILSRPFVAKAIH